MVLNFVALLAPFALTLLDIALVSGQSNEAPKTVVENSDPQMTYSPALCPDAQVANCLGAWWDTTLANGSVIKTTAGPSSGYKNVQTTLSYSFYGSSIEIYGLADTQGANMVIEIDNFLAIVNTSTGIVGASREPRMLYNYSVLDSQTAHTLSVGWSANMNPNVDAGGYYPLSYAYFDHLVIGDFRAVMSSSTSLSSSVTPSATTSASAVASSIQATSAKLDPGSLAGIIIVILLVTLLCASSCYLLHRYRHPLFRPRRLTSPHIRVMIESRETRDILPSPTQSESWKPRPHLSLPPAYGHANVEVSEKASYGAERGDSYLDLESGTRKSTSQFSHSPDPPDPPEERKKRISLLPVSPSPARSPSVSYPPRAKLQVNTRESVIAPHRHPFARDTDAQSQEDQVHSPVTPFTPYCVGTAIVARPQNATLVPKSSLTIPTSTIPLPPLPPIPDSRDEKRRHGKHLSSSRRSRKASRAHLPEETNGEADICMLQISGSTTLQADFDRAATTSRPSFDAMSVMTRSVPPPYTLHV